MKNKTACNHSCRLFACFVLVAAGALPACFASSAFAQENVSCGNLIEVASLQLDAHTGTAIPVAIAGHDLRLAVATGSVASLLSNEESDRLSLARRALGGTLFTLDGVTPKELAVANDIQIGQLYSPEWPFVLVPESILPSGMDGALGTDLLHSYDIDVDFGANRVRLVSPQHCAGRVVYWTKLPVAIVPLTIDAKWRISVPVTLDGVETTAAIDTGAPTSAIAGQFASDNFRSPAFHALSFEGVTIANPKLAVIAGVAGPGTPPIVIGEDLLKRFHLYIAYGEKRLYLTAANAH